MRTILIVSGRGWVRDLMRVVAGFLGNNDEVNLINASDAVEAMDKIEKEKPSVIVMELFLTGISGVNLLDEIIMRKDDFLRKIIVLSDFEFNFELSNEYKNVNIVNLESVTPKELASVVKSGFNNEKL